MNLDQAEKIAVSLMEKHQLTNWSFAFDRAKVRFGCCHYTKKTITLSRYLTELNTEAHVRDTILHEIAHALVGKKHNHDRIWKAKALEIGCKPRRCYDVSDIKLPLRKYTAQCPQCKITFQTQKKRRVACATCCKKYNDNRYSSAFRIIFTENKHTSFTKRVIRGI